MAIALFASAGTVCGQDGGLFPERNPLRPEDMPPNFKEMVAKQQAAKDKKDHEEMLQRGKEAVELSGELEKAFARSASLSAPELRKLESLEKLVVKIRGELGGDDDGEEAADEVIGKKPSTLIEACRYLQNATAKLMDELKKTTRFSISAAAIQSSNTVIRLVKFLRLRK